MSNDHRTVYRVTLLETSLASQQQQQQKLTEDLAELKGDMKVVKEAVLRPDAARAAAKPSDR